MNTKRVFNNFFWRFMERCGAQGVTFVVSIVLGRILGPEAYGTIGLVTVFITIMQVFIDGGFGNSLIRKKDADELDFSSVFYANMAMCLGLYILMYFAAPWIASFYERPELIAVVRVLSLILLFSALKNVQLAYVAQKLLFKRYFFASIGGTLGAAVVGIYMAVKGYGVWALVGQKLFNVGVNTLIMWFTVRWRPKLQFSWERLKGLLSYGWRILVAKLIDTVYHDLRQLVIGKMYSSADLAYYNQGKRIPHFLVTNINTTIDSVLLPTLAQAQDDKERLRAMTRRAIKTSTYIMMPLMVGMAICAEPLVRLLLKDQWLPCVPLMQIFCISYAFRPVQTANLNAIKALGRSDLFLRLEILKKAVGILSLVATMWISVEAIAYSLLFSSLVSQIINSWPNRKLLNYSYFNQLSDMLPQIALSCLMGGVVYLVSFLQLPTLLLLFVQVAVGAAVYVAGSLLLKVDSFHYILKVLKAYLKKKGGKKVA